MKLYKNIKKIILFIGILIVINPLCATLNWMKADNFWFAGYMYISGDSQLSYRLLNWNTNSNSWELRDPLFRTNTVINVRDLLGGLHNTPYMYWGGSTTNSTNIALVPSIAQGSVFDKAKAQQFDTDVKAGKYAPYIVISRRQTSIDIYIIGPVFTISEGSENLTQFVSRKITFNFLPFEDIYVRQTIWYKNLNTHWPEGIAFAPSFNVDIPNKNAYFAGTYDDNQFAFDPNKTRQNKILANNALYLYGLEKQDDALGWSWTYQGSENFNLPISKVIYQYVDKNKKTITAERGIDQHCDDGGTVNMQNQCKICDSTGCYMAQPIRFDNNGMTLQALQDKGIVTYQSAVPLDELQGIINFLNATGYAKFESVL